MSDDAVAGVPLSTVSESNPDSCWQQQRRTSEQGRTSEFEGMGNGRTSSAPPAHGGGKSRE